MKQIEFGTTGEKVSAIALGCMRMNRLSVSEAAAQISRAVELGVTFFDHADIYGGGQCEEIFGAALGETGIPRDKLDQLFTGQLYRKDLPSDSNRGMGIGLSVCSAIIKAHGSMIYAENLKKGGASFYFSLEMEDKS